MLGRWEFILGIINLRHTSVKHAGGNGEFAVR